MGLRVRRGLYVTIILISYGIADVDLSLPVDLAVEEKGKKRTIRVIL